MLQRIKSILGIDTNKVPLELIENLHHAFRNEVLDSVMRSGKLAQIRKYAPQIIELLEHVERMHLLVYPKASDIELGEIRKDIIIGLIAAPNFEILLNNLEAFSKIVFSSYNEATILSFAYGLKAPYMLANPEAAKMIVACYNLTNATCVAGILAESPNTPLLLENSVAVAKILGSNPDISGDSLFNALKLMANHREPEALKKIFDRADDVQKLADGINGYRRTAIIDSLAADKREVLIDNAAEISSLAALHFLGQEPQIAMYEKVKFISELVMAEHTPKVFAELTTVFRIADELGMPRLSVVRDLAKSPNAEAIIVAADSVIAKLKEIPEQNRARETESAFSEILGGSQRLPAFGQHTVQQTERAAKPSQHQK